MKPLLLLITMLLLVSQPASLCARQREAANQTDLIQSLITRVDQLEKRVADYIAQNRDRGIVNASALLIDFNTMEVLAQLGSSDFSNVEIKGQDVLPWRAPSALADDAARAGALASRRRRRRRPARYRGRHDNTYARRDAAHAVRGGSR